MAGRPKQTKALTAYAKRSGKIAGEAFRGGGTFMQQMNRAARTLPPAQGARLLRTARTVKAQFVAQKKKPTKSGAVRKPR